MTLLKILYLYRYGILGGVTTQLANRLSFLTRVAEPHFAFIHDYGGRTAFGDHPHTHVVPTNQEVAELVRGGSFDIVLPIDTPQVYPALRAARFTGTVINEVHTTTANLGYLADLQGERIHAFLAPSAYLAGRIENEFEVGREIPCHSAPNCLDTARFRFRDPGAAATPRPVLWVGKLDDHKNWRGFLDLGRRLAAERADVELWLIGGETAPDDTVQKLFDVAADHGLTGCLRWLPRVEYRRMPRLYSLVAASGGVSVSTSQDESFGMTVVESLACGCPVVAARVGAIPEILCDELSVGLYDFGDLHSGAVAARALLDEREVRGRMIAAGRHRVEREFALEPAGERYLEVLDRVHRSRRPQQPGAIS